MPTNFELEFGSFLAANCLLRVISLCLLSSCDFLFKVWVGMGSIAVSCSLDLELGKVDKDLLKVGPDQREVLNDVPLEERGQLAESI